MDSIHAELFYSVPTRPVAVVEGPPELPELHQEEQEPEPVPSSSSRRPAEPSRSDAPIAQRRVSANGHLRRPQPLRPQIFLPDRCRFYLASEDFAEGRRFDLQIPTISRVSFHGQPGFVLAFGTLTIRGGSCSTISGTILWQARQLIDAIITCPEQTGGGGKADVINSCGSRSRTCLVGEKNWIVDENQAAERVGIRASLVLRSLPTAPASVWRFAHSPRHPRRPFDCECTDRVKNGFQQFQ